MLFRRWSKWYYGSKRSSQHAHIVSEVCNHTVHNNINNNNSNPIYLQYFHVLSLWLLFFRSLSQTSSKTSYTTSSENSSLTNHFIPYQSTYSSSPPPSTFCHHHPLITTIHFLSSVVRMMTIQNSLILFPIPCLGDKTTLIGIFQGKWWQGKWWQITNTP